MTEVDVDEVEGKSSNAEKAIEAKETHFLVSKLETSKASVIPSCLSSCDGNNPAGATIEENSCFIDGVCYASEETGELFGKVCFACNPTVSQTDWTVRDNVGVEYCFVDDICVKDGGFKWSQRRTWAAKTFSTCQVCDASNDAYGWTILDGASVPDESILPPNDCIADNAADETTEVPAPAPDIITIPPPETSATVKVASSSGVLIALNMNAIGSIIALNVVGISIVVDFVL